MWLLLTGFGLFFGIEIPGINFQDQKYKMWILEQEQNYWNNSKEYTFYAQQTESVMYYESSKGTQEGIWMKAKGDYQDRVHSDQIVLVKVMRGGWTAWAVANSKQRGNTWVKSTQMRWFLGSQAEEAGLLKQWPKDTQRKS
jgi:hypothetical protein